ncbi:MAG: M23 family metallopeptidase [Saprospiraceae bacterium]
MNYSWFPVQFLANATSFAMACLLPNIKPLVQPLLISSSRLVRFGTLLLLSACIFVASSFRFAETPTIGAFPLVVPTINYGLELERFDHISTLPFGEEQTLNQFLEQVGVRAVLRRESILHVREHFDAERTSNEHARLFYANGKLIHVAIPMDHIGYLRIDLLADRVTSGDLEGIQSEYSSTTLFFNGNIDSTLRYTLLAESLQQRIRKAFTIDMPLDTGFHLGVVQVVYTVKRDENGETVGFGEVEALRYRVNQEERTSIRFVDRSLDVEGFFNPDGSPVQQTWLTSPIPGARISSPFNLRRRHPILKRIKPHYGTDYAAPYGTPIRAVSDGVVVARARTRTNGNYLKIRHNETYVSQYLHLKGFASIVKPGAQVKKGQVIGYVGSTGLSSGPHVCFRFWKNGRQIDHRKESLLTTEELTTEAMAAFEKKQAELQSLLDIKA